MNNEKADNSEDQVPPDDVDATTPLGVGKSVNQRGEDVETTDSGDTDRSTEEKGDGAAPPSEERTGINP